MIQGAPGLDVSALARGVLASPENQGPSLLAQRLMHSVGRYRGRAFGALGGDAYDRLFATKVGNQAASLIGNETRTLYAISSLSLEILFEYLQELFPPLVARPEVRVLAVPGAPTERPSLLILDPVVPDVSQSQRITDSIDLDPQGLIVAMDRLRPFMARRLDRRLFAAVGAADSQVHAALELLSVSLPEIILTRRPRMEPLCVPIPHIATKRGIERSSVGVFCRDPTGVLGVTACLHGTGPVGTAVQVGDVKSVVAHADTVQDIVFIPLPEQYAMPALWGRRGVRNDLAPSEAEPVSFEGAGTQARIGTRVKSHDAGILRQRSTLQLKVQTPADTNRGDSGCGLVDGNDRVIGFAFERTGLGEFPELTDWIWADNALRTLNLTPV